MTRQVYEVMDSMSGSITKELGAASVWEVKRRYVVGPCLSFDDCASAMENYAPMYVAGNFGWQIRSSFSATSVGNGYFDVVATYRTLNPVGGAADYQGGGGGAAEYIPGSVAWDTTGNREHITQAIEQESFPDDAADFEGAINVSGDSVQGIDVVRPAMRYSETWVMALEKAMNCNYLGNIYRLTGTVNANSFRCFDPGEVLFVGARGQWQEDQPYVSVTFEFEARANDDEYYPWQGYGGTITKEGWEHFWIRYEDGVDAQSIIKRPIAAYKSRVYRKKSWSALGIESLSIGGPRSGILAQDAAPPGQGLV